MKLLTFVFAASLVAGNAAATEVEVTVNNGMVTIVARDATVRQIIAEWARVGQAKVVNAERIPGGPMTIELRNVPESQALDTLLRSAAGYLAAPRAVAAANLSRFDRVVVMPVSAAPRIAVTQPPVFQPPQQFQQPPAAVPDDQEEDRPVNVAAPVPNPRGPIFNAFPQPQVVNPQTGTSLPVTVGGQPAPFVNPQSGAPVPAVQHQPVQQPVYGSTPTAPFGGVAVPGMVAPAPNQQPGAPGQLTPPGQVRRPGGNEH